MNSVTQFHINFVFSVYF